MPTITPGQAVQYARSAGFSGQALVTIIAIAMAESNLNTTVQNSIGATGILQILLSAHPDVSYSQAIDPAFSFKYAYRLSNGGKNFCAWQSYDSNVCGVGWDNRYKQYLLQAQAAVGLGTGGTGTATSSTVQSASSNKYPKGQCTWWANERYHQLAGYYVPWMANASGWLNGAKSSGWNTSTQPPSGIASIIVLQPGVQLADPTYGHVGVVERINVDGSIYTSDQNWGTTAADRAKTSYITFNQGRGVNFVWANSAAGNAATTTSNPLATLIHAAAGQASYTSVLDQVHQTLTANEGFYGIALSLDEAEQFPGWVNLSNGPLDIPGIIRSVGATMSDNAVPFALREGTAGLGLFIILLLLIKVILDVGEQGIDVAGKLAPLIGAFV